MAMDVVDYEIKGAEMQFVEVELDPGEAAVGEAGSMMFMENGIVLDTVFGDGSQQNSGLWGALVGAGKRLVSGANVFTTVFMNQSGQKRRVAFAAPVPGKILAVDLRSVGGTLICQKQAFLCAARGVSLGIAFQQRLGVGFFGGEGLFFAKVTGPGTVWIQSLPFSRLASRIFAAAPQNGGGSDRAGSSSGAGVLGGLAAGGILGGLGSLLSGDDD